MAIDREYKFTPSKRALPYMSLVRETEEEYGLPKNLLANVLHTESRFKPDARSNKGAIGIAQIVPKWHPDVKDPTDPVESIRYAGKYLAENYKRFGDWDKTLASYNWGPTAVAKHGMSKLPEETRNYLTKINKNRTQVGKSKEPDESEVALRQLAEGLRENFKAAGSLGKHLAKVNYERFIKSPLRAMEAVGDVITGKRQLKDISQGDITEALSAALGGGLPFAPKGAAVAGITKRQALKNLKYVPKDAIVGNKGYAVSEGARAALARVSQKTLDPIKDIKYGDLGLSTGTYTPDYKLIELNPSEIATRRGQQSVYEQAGETLWHEMTHGRQFNPQKSKIKVKGFNVDERRVSGEARLQDMLFDVQKMKAKMGAKTNLEEEQRIAGGLYSANPIEVHARDTSSYLKGRKPFDEAYVTSMGDVMTASPFAKDLYSGGIEDLLEHLVANPKKFQGLLADWENEVKLARILRARKSR